MYNNIEAPRYETSRQRQPTHHQYNPFGYAFNGASSGLLKIGTGAHGEKFLGSRSEDVQSNGHWTGIAEPVQGRMCYKPAVYDIYDIIVPDLYIPFLAFNAYILLASLSLGLDGKFTPEALNWIFMKGVIGWFLQFALLKVALLSLGGADEPVLDNLASAGYSFVGLSSAVLGNIIWSPSYYILMLLTCTCSGMLFAQSIVRVPLRNSSMNNHLWLLMHLAQLPVLMWLGNISLNWLF